MISSLNTKLDIPLIALILANLTPIYGVLFGEWTVFQVFFLFWGETAVIGFYNILKIKRTSGALGFFLIPFFILHFGGFMFGHLIFIITLFGFGMQNVTISLSSAMIINIGRVLIFPILFYFVSHGISYYVNFIQNEEYKRSNPMQVMMAPYGRVALMHITIIFGGWIVLGLGVSSGALALLIFGKILLDVTAHNRTHAKLSLPTPVLVTQK